MNQLQPSELRIGNRILIPVKKNQFEWDYVAEIHQERIKTDHSNDYYRYDEIKPEPLNDAILNNWGFETQMLDLSTTIITNSKYRYGIFCGDFIDLVPYKDNYFMDPNFLLWKSYQKTINVHDLQNLHYTLTGINLR